MVLLLQTLSSQVQQHLLTIQQLTEQVQALTSLKQSQSTADHQNSDQDSVTTSQVIDIDIDTFPGLENKAKDGINSEQSTDAISVKDTSINKTGRRFTAADVTEEVGCYLLPCVSFCLRHVQCHLDLPYPSFLAES